MQVRAIHAIVAGGEYHAPGALLEFDAEECDRLVGLGAAEHVQAEPFASEAPAAPGTGESPNVEDQASSPPVSRKGKGR